MRVWIGTPAQFAFGRFDIIDKYDLIEIGVTVAFLKLPNPNRYYPPPAENVLGVMVIEDEWDDDRVIPLKNVRKVEFGGMIETASNPEIRIGPLHDKGCVRVEEESDAGSEPEAESTGSEVSEE